MRKQAIGIFATSLVVFLSACAAQKSDSTSTEAEASAATAVAVTTPAPAGTKLAKVQLGMSKKQVSDIMGQPTDENSYATGKMWIPFYFGNDVRRTSWYYKGTGQVIFADGNAFGGGTPEVMDVVYDPTESGVAR